MFGLDNIFKKDDYKRLNNAYTKRVDKGDHSLEVEVGDVKQPDKFYPQFKIKKWNNESNFSIRLSEDAQDTPNVNFKNNKIERTDSKKNISFYDIGSSEDFPDGGYEFQIDLKEKPSTNKVVFTIQTKNLRFGYQPSLKEEFQSGYNKYYKKEIIVTDTHVKDLEGNILQERPENIVGSYSVYHKNRKGNYKAMGGPDYGTGKVGHIYRPRVEDAAGNKVWGKLSIDEKKGLLIAEIPQEFLDSAVYPIKHASGLTFGYATVGGSSGAYYGEDIHGESGTAALGGTAQSIKMYSKVWNLDPLPMKGVLALLDDGTLVSNGVGNAVNVTTATPAWYTSSFATPPTIVANEDYVVACIWQSSPVDTYGIYIYYDSGASDPWYRDLTNSYSSPQNCTWDALSGYDLSMYLTYTPTGQTILFNMDTAANWINDTTTGGDQNGATLETATKQEGIGSVKFNVDVSLNANNWAYFREQTTSKNLSSIAETGYIRFYIYIPDVTYFSGVNFRIGSDISNFYGWSGANRINAPYGGGSWQNGWNLVEVPWSASSPKTGTPVTTALDFWQFGFDYTASQGDTYFLIDYIYHDANPLTTALADTLTLVYNLLQNVNDTLTLKYHIKNFLNDALSLVWNIKNNISDNLTVVYNILAGIVNDVLTIKYHIKNNLNDTLTLKYHIKNLASNTRTFIYNIIQNIADTLTVKYNIFNNVFDSLSVKWHIKNKISDSLTMIWSITGTVSKALSMLYNILSYTVGYRQVPTVSKVASSAPRVAKVEDKAPRVAKVEDKAPRIMLVKKL